MISSKRHVSITEVDDVLAPKRQHEIKMLIENLTRWKSEIIAVEFPRDKEDELNRKKNRRYPGKWLNKR